MIKSISLFFHNVCIFEIAFKLPKCFSPRFYQAISDVYDCMS